LVSVFPHATSHWLTLVCTVGCIACSGTAFFYTTREFWRKLFDTFNATSSLTKLVVFVTDGGATCFAGRVAPRPPQGFIEEGQNLEWSTNTFASDAIAEPARLHTN